MRVGIAGLGKMGSAFAENLIGKKHQVKVWDRSAEHVQRLVALGAESAASPEELVQGLDAVLVMLWDDNAAREITLGRIIPAATPPTVVIEMSTLSPAMYQTLGQAAERKGLEFLASPVLGSVDLARTGKLTVLASGEQKPYERVRDLLGALGRTMLVGPVGSSAFLKLANNSIIGIVAESMRELLRLCVQAGIDESIAIDSLSGAFDRIADSKVKQLHEHDTEPRFSLGALYKDLLLAREAGAHVNVPLPLLDTVIPSVKHGIDEGLADRDYIALVFADGNLATAR
ncbi:MAG: NAD(P)-dependent oxidoreductase [Vulcanimicrobiaceae bacterium]|jgi:3-hydroxyisobutyrate dehydrogenase